MTINSSEAVTIAHNAVIAKLHEPSRSVKLRVQSLLSYKVEGAEHSASFKMGNWDGRSSFFDFRTGTFPAGFVNFVAGNLTREGYRINRVRKPLPLPLGPEKPKVDAFPEDPRYDYQMETVNRLLKHGSMIAQVATGGGKSRIARLAFMRINRPTLFLTTRGILMYQMKETFEKDLGIPCSVLGDGQFGHTDKDGRQFIKKMSVGMVQTLVSRLQEPNPDDPVDVQNRQTAIRNQTIALLGKFEFVIGEEAHEASGNSYYEILRHCKNAHYRLAITATPFMKDNEESNMRLMAAFGSIGIKVSEKMLIDRGILAKPIFKIVTLKDKPKNLMRGTPWQGAYRLGIVNNDERNRLVVAESARAARHGLSTMVLIQQKAHGHALLELMAQAGIRAEFIYGENDQAERKKALQKLATNEVQVLIGSTILDVGVDVPAVGLVILAGGGKAEVALRQRIGRGLRAKKSGPNIALIVDFYDEHNRYLKEHSLQRISIIKGTEGFGENILPDGQDFDYAKLGLAKSDRPVTQS